MSDQPLLKAELHAHLEGTISPDFAARLAARRGQRLPDDLLDDQGRYRWQGFSDFLNCYDRVAGLIATPEDYSDLTFDYLARCAAEDCIYVELICSPDHGAAVGLAYPTMLAAIADGIDRARAAFGIEARMLQSIVRHYGVENARKSAQIIVDHPHPYVVGLQMAGAEAMHSVRDFAPCFALAREAGLGLSAHAGEVCGPESVRDCLTYLPGLHRIGHGVRSVEDPALVADLAARGLHLEVCPGSNIAIGVFPSFDQHSLPRLLAAGVDCSLSSDDPPFFATTIGREYAIAAEHFGLDRDRLLGLTRAALRAAFVDEPTRAQLLKRLN